MLGRNIQKLKYGVAASATKVCKGNETGLEFNNPTINPASLRQESHHRYNQHQQWYCKSNEKSQQGRKDARL
jgi:hypothetical protein